MFIFYRLVLILIIFNLLLSCKEKITYSGKIINEENFNFTKLENKDEVINLLGNPNFIDPIEKKYYYFSEKKSIKNFYKQNITNRIMLVFIFNENDEVQFASQYNLNDEKDIRYIKDKTPNELVKRGLIKKIFGGIGNTVPNTSQ